MDGAPGLFCPDFLYSGFLGPDFLPVAWLAAMVAL